MVTLVRDRLAGELARREDALRLSGSEDSRTLEEAGTAKRWLADLQRANPWLEHPFLIRDEAVLVGAVHANWPRHIDDPLVGLAAVSSLVNAAEATEFARGDPSGALPLYRAALDRTPAHSRVRTFVRTRIARTLIKLGRIDAGIDIYRQVVAEAGHAVDRHGLPFAVIALVQIADASSARGRNTDADEAGRRLLAYVVDHPWDLTDGYGVYLNRALQLAATADSTLKEKARVVAGAAARVEWVQKEITPRINSARGQGAEHSAVTQHLLVEWEGQRTLVGQGKIPRARSLRLGYEVNADAVSGEMLERVRAAIDADPDVSIQVLTSGPSVAATVAVPLVRVPLLADVPGWEVALVDRRGRSVRQIVAREQWTYGALVSGMLAVMMVGVLLAARTSSRAAELSWLKTQFVSNVSHELKTPLSLIRMFGETLESGLVSDEAKRREFSAIIKHESERLTHLIDNVLDLGKIEAGCKSYEFARTDLGDTVRQAVEAYRPLFVRQGFVVELDLSATTIELSLDRYAIAQALVNLFQNVIKYSDACAYVRVSVTAAGNLARVSVTDRGIGIDADEIPHIFEPYYRVANDTARSGSGLGLSIVRHVVAAHGGRVDVESTRGAGSTFTIILPIGAVPAAVRDQMRAADAGV